MDPWLAPNFIACMTVKTKERNGENPVDPENRLRKQEWHRYAGALSMHFAQSHMHGREFFMRRIIRGWPGSAVSPEQMREGIEGQSYRQGCFFRLSFLFQLLIVLF